MSVTTNHLVATSPTQYRAATCSSIRDVDWTEWNQLRDPEGDLFMDPRYLLAVENSMGTGADCRFRYVVVRAECGKRLASCVRRPASRTDKESADFGELSSGLSFGVEDSRGEGTPTQDVVAVACLSACTIDGPSLVDGTARKVVTAIDRFRPGLLGLRMLLCGLPVSCGSSHLRFAPDADRAAVLRVLDQVMQEFAAEERAHVFLFKEFEPGEAEELTSLEELGYRRADSLPMNCVPAEYRSFEEYLAGISSAKRYKIQHSRKKAKTLGLTFEHRTGAEGAAEVYTDEVHALYEAVLERATVRFERLPAEFFRELARQLPQEALFTFARHEGRIVGFALSLSCQGRLGEGRFDQMFMGVDYDLNRKLDIYFNLFYEALGTAFAGSTFGGRARRIYVGQTTDDVKHEKLGAYQVPLTLYAKGRRPLVSAVLATRFKWFFPDRPIKHPK